jgi:hypothetical protein
VYWAIFWARRAILLVSRAVRWTEGGECDENKSVRDERRREREEILPTFLSPPSN